MATSRARPSAALAASSFSVLANLDSLHPNGDIIIASALALQDGSGFMTDPLACHRR